MTKYFYFTIICFFLLLSSGKAQFSYVIAEDIAFYKDGQKLTFPMVGGINSPIFNQFDLNLDGKMDMVVFEKFGNLLYPFINDGDSNEIKYIYDPSYIDKFPKNLEYWMISADYNCDGKMDLYLYSPSAIMTYENISSSSSGLQFGNPTKLSFPSGGFTLNLLASRIDLPAIYDIDADGDLDILVFGEPQIFYYKNMSMENSGNCGLEYERISRCWGKITEGAISSLIYLDTCIYGEYSNAERTKAKHAGSTITALDIDGNSTADLLVGDVSQTHLTLLINGDQTSDRTSSHIISKDSLFPSYDTSVNLLSFPAAYHMDVNNDNIKDLIVSSFNNDRFEVVATENMVHLYKNTTKSVNPKFALQQKNFLVEDMIDIGRGAHPVFYDHNKDGLLDIIAGNLGSYNEDSNKYVGKLFYFENTGTSTSPEFTLRNEDYAGISSIKLHGKNGTAMALYPAFADLDADGKSEMMLGDELGRLHLFTDTSTSQNTSSFALLEANFDKIDLYRYAIPQFYDLNKDSLVDLIVGRENGLLDFFPNWGTATVPQFNLDVDSIIYLRDSVVRYYLDPNQNISPLKLGDELNFYGEDNYINSGIKEVLAIDHVNQSVDVFSEYVNSQNYVNEYSSNKKAFYGIDSLGGVDIRNRYALNGNPTPLFYDFEGETQLLSGSKIGTIYHYTNIDNLDSNFTLSDTNFLSADFGSMVYLSGADINQDGKMDLIIGNEAGGFKIFYASGYLSTGPEMKLEAKQLKVYPNPSKESFNIELKDWDPKDELTISISNILGQNMYHGRISQNKMKISTTNWPNGIYLINLSNSHSSSVAKVIVRH